MNPKLFEVLGNVAGLAGLGLGIVGVIFLAVLKLNIFPTLSKDSAYRLLRQVIYLTFFVGVVGILAWLLINVKARASSAITGHVADSATKAPIYDALITVSGRKEDSRIDSVGLFSLSFNRPLPDEPIRIYIAKIGYEPYNRLVGLGQNLDAEIAPTTPIAQHQPPPPPQFTTTTEVYTTDDVASGACAGMGAWATLCTPDKPQGWTIIDQNFQLTGDRAGCQWANCQPLGTPSSSKACYRFQTQGHSEECHPFSSNTGIHYSKGVLRVTWQHPA